MLDKSERENGLLVLPEQAYFLSHREYKAFEDLPILNQYIGDQSNYKNTYKRHLQNEDAPFVILFSLIFP